MRACDNPFATHRVLRVRYRLQGMTWDDLLARLESLEFRAAIVGPKGSGKTTLLEDLEAPLHRLGFTTKNLRLDETRRKFPPDFLADFFTRLSSRDIILFDGAEQMSWLAWRSFRQRARRVGGLIATSHRAGLLPTLIQCSTTPELLGEIVAELGESTQDAPALFEKHRGNLREALRELYDMHAAQEESFRTK